MFLFYRRCCRVWPLSPMWKVGKCGYCGQRPEAEATESEYEQQR